MIVRVSIENLVIVEAAEFEPGPGLTCVTGETGAGKTLLAGAIALLFGADADGGQVGAAGGHAWVEGEFEVGEAFWADPSVAALAGLRPEGEDTLVLARRVGREGRSRAMAWGRTVTKGDLAAAGALLVASAGQHAQRRLMLPAFQRGVLDGAGDAAHAALVTASAQAWRVLEQARVEHARIHEQAAAIAARGDEIADALARIEAVDPALDDERDLQARRDRARHHAELHEGVAAALASTSGDGAGAVDALGAAYSAVANVAEFDAGLATVAESLLHAQQLASDASASLRARLDELAEAPASIDEIEERLSAYDELKRRFGGTVESVLHQRDELRLQAELLADTDGACRRADEQLAAAQSAAEAAALALRASRTELGAQLGARVKAELADLGMADSVFAVAIDEAALGVHGADRVEFRIAPAAGIEPRPVSQVASGGELSRVALALMVATGAHEAGTIVFDEIDAGIGGHTAHAIGAKLRQLAAHTQVVCITHLAQVAARATTHVHIAKTAGSTTLTTLHDDAQVLDELCRMMGADPTDPAARTHAANLRGERLKRTRTKAADTQLALD